MNQIDNNILSEEDFIIIRDFIHKTTAIFLEPTKKYLIVQRFHRILKQENISSLHELTLLIKKGLPPEIKEQLISAITTNETFFFRDNHPFETFSSVVLPEVTNSSRNRLSPFISILSIGTSTGQEAYSLAILIDEFLKQNRSHSNRQIQISATDIDEHVLKRAKQGRYSLMEIKRGLSAEQKQKYFRKRNLEWEITPELKKYIHFRKECIHTSDFNYTEKYHIIFARNILIYFDKKTKLQVLNKLHRALKPGGWLFLGASENLYGLKTHFTTEIHNKTVLYRKAVAN